MAIAPLKPIAQINISDSLALVDLYDSTNGDNWNPDYGYNWKTSAPVKSWAGISVRNNRVVGIYMVGNHLTGTIPASFANLDSMQGITFIDNGFRGDFLPYISNFKGMINIHIGEQFLPGPIPSAFGYLPKLVELTIYGPDISGPIPASLGNLTNLKEIDVGYSKHSGDIPAEELSNLNLDYFMLAGNLFTFKEIEPLVQIFKSKNKEAVLDYSSMANIPTIQRNDELVVAAGGVPQHNTYQWYKTGTGLVANYNGTNTSSLQLLNIPSSWYGRKYKCVANAVNSTVFTLYFANAWISGGTSNWEDVANWSCGKLPDANTDVIINSGTVVLNSNVTVRSLQLADGVNFTVGAGYKLTIKN